MLQACDDCALNEDCGWCGAENRCVSDAERRQTCSGPEAQYVRATSMCEAVTYAGVAGLAANVPAKRLGASVPPGRGAAGRSGGGGAATAGEASRGEGWW